MTQSTGTAGGASRARMQPDERREQLLDLGVRLLATRSLEELSIEVLAEQAGISRGLLYHYFGGKQEYHLAVVQRAADELYDVTAPDGVGDPVTQLTGSLERYVDYVVSNFEGYVSLVRAAGGGNDDLRRVYERARSALTDRLFEAAGATDVPLPDDARTRLLVRGWAAFVEEVVVAWARDPHGVTRDDLLASLGGSLLALVG